MNLNWLVTVKESEHCGDFYWYRVFY